MNWRLTDHNKDHFYDNANTGLFPGLNNTKNDSSTEWFQFLKDKKLRTYFNDHPFPVDNQTSKKEVAFRWKGLSTWMDMGLDFWCVSNSSAARMLIASAPLSLCFARLSHCIMRASLTACLSH
jgi:hypothetical protein